MENPVKTQFDKIAEAYDGQRRKIIPCYDDFYGLAAFFAETRTNGPRILDIGAGTGLFSAYLHKKYPQAEITLFDVSERMLDVARERFAGLDNIRFVVMDYGENKIKERYDLVISALSIHHLEDSIKRELFQNIYDILNPGGVFVNADQCIPENASIIDRFNACWHGHIRKHPFSQAEIDAIRERRALDRESKLSDYLSWLKQAGFNSVECVYRYLHFCVTVAEK